MAIAEEKVPGLPLNLIRPKEDFRMRQDTCHHCVSVLAGSRLTTVAPLSALSCDLRTQCGVQQRPGGHAACRCAPDSGTSNRNFGYQRRNTSSSSLFRTFVRVCNNRCAPFSVQLICWRLTKRRLTTWLIVDSTNAVLIVSPCLYRSPKLGIDPRLFRM